MNKFKTDYRHILLAFRADIKAYGGFHKAAEQVNVTHDTLCSQTNPNSIDVNPPTLTTFIELINAMEAKRTVAALASLVDQITLDQHDSSINTAQDDIEAFLILVESASAILGKGSQFAIDKRFDVHEREQLLPMLMSLIQVSGQLYRKLNK